MRANEVIDAYVADVAVRLPRARRDDVAFELRALLLEALQDDADAAGRPADEAMALSRVRASGRPADVAARYRTPVTIIDPADGGHFLRMTVIGLAIFWIAGFASALQGGGDVLSMLGRWWTGTVIASLWWPGVLVVGFGLAAWGRRRASPVSDWTPRAPDAVSGGRPGVAFGLVAAVLGATALVEPTRILDVFWGGAAAPAAYAALTYADGFLALRGPVLFALVAANVAILAAVLVLGRRPVALRRVEAVLAIVTIVAMAWVATGGPILQSAAGDRTAKAALVLIAAGMAIVLAVQAWRRVRPAPQVLGAAR